MCRAGLRPTAPVFWGVRGVMRTYTIRGTRARPAEIDVDFALHGDLGARLPLGPAGRCRATGCPSSRRWPPTTAASTSAHPRARTGYWLTADETALPAVAAILERRPPGMPVRVFVEVGHPDDRIPLPTKADAGVTWLVRTGADRTDPLLSAVAGAGLPPGTSYAWPAGESACVRALRRHLVSARGLDRSRITFTGDRRQGTTEDDLLAQAAAASA